MGFYFKQPIDDDADHERAFKLVQQILDMLDDDQEVTAETFDWGDINNKLTDEQIDQIKQQLRDALDAES
jgi:hypothetical protein